MSEFRFNVAQLLQESVGATRHYELDDKELALGEGSFVRPVKGHVRLTRTHKGVLADVDAHGAVELECARCLSPLSAEIAFPFGEEYYQTVVVNTGAALPRPEEPDVFLIDETHKLDLAEAMREYGLLALPMLPLCRPDCAGLCPECGVNLNDEPEHMHEPEEDDRLMALKQLLERPE